MSENIINYKQLRHKLGQQTLLDISEFNIPQNCCIAISGKNGSGKSTLMRIMAGLLKPESACIEIQNKHASWSNALKAIRANVIYLHQTPYLFDASVRDNIAYGLNLKKLKKNDINQRVDAMLDWANLNHLAKRNAQFLSGGEKQRVAFARAQILRPKVLLLDEPTVNMDKHARHQTWEMVEQLKNEQLSVVISTHEYDSIAHICNQLYYLDSGQLHARQPTLKETSA